MNDSSKLLAKEFENLREHGFLRRALVWCKSTPETLFSFELQRSKHADRYYVNVGVHFASLGSATHLPPNKCHFYGRFGSPDTEAALSFEEETPEDRAHLFAQFKERELLPACAACATTSGAVAFFKSGVLRIPFVLPQARQVLGLDGE